MRVTSINPILLLSLIAWWGSAQAKDHAPPVDNHEIKTSSKPSKASQKEATDPMDTLREKLAAKLSKNVSSKQDDVSDEPSDKGSASRGADRVREKIASRLGGTLAPHEHSAPSDPVIRVSARPTVAAESPARIKHKMAAAPVAHKRTYVGSSKVIGASAEHVAKLGASHDSVEHAMHWSYQGEGGPQAWGQLKPEFAACSSGKRQSPIDIRDGFKVQLDAVRFDYRPSGFKVIDNGHTIQVIVAPGNTIEVMGRRYELLQFHFHRPSEERVNGRQFDMVAHLVHKDTDGKLAVIAVLLDRGGNSQPLVQTIWNNLPLEKGEEFAAAPSIDLNDILPHDRSYYTYMGSLTTPPCTEGVLWMVMKNAMSISQDQVNIFARLYPMNARPVQSVSGRVIKESN